VHVGDAEVLLDDAIRLADRARGAGVPVELEVWSEAFHVFQMLAGMLPEADEAIAQAGAWMAKRLEAG
jgi:acetyl esterase/lipase